MLYRIVITGRDYVPVGELANFGDFSFVRALNKLATCSFRVNLANTHADRLAACDANVKVYRGANLVFAGPVVTAEESVERNTNSIQVNCSDAGWHLTKRLFGRGPGGRVFAALTDRAAIAKTLIDGANDTQYTGISTTAYTLTSGSQITWRSPPYRVVLEGIVELGSSLDGFDWRIVPVENWASGAKLSDNIGAFEAKTVIGVQKPNAVFEYGSGTRSNVLSYNRTTSRETQATRVTHQINDGSDAITGNNTSAATSWGIMEASVDAALNDATFRQKLVDEHAAVRGFPRTFVRMTPHIDPGVTGRLPQPLVDYDVGDQVQFRAVYGNKLRFAGWLRVYGIQVNVENETGFERVNLVLEDEA